jgi:Flp pilus assembly protein TadD
LQIQPKHPDANHNLGLIAVSMDQSGVALPLFKNAVKVNPNIEQFWVSYIEALITERQFENAKRALKQGKKKGVAKEKIKALTQKLVSVKAGDNLMQAPSQAEMQKLLNHYQNGRYGDAEKLAISITEQFPEHQFGWKALGAVLKQTNRISETLVSSQKAVEITPQDAEAHNNLGITLKELGRLEESEASLRQAIALKPNYAEAYSNLGITLQELGRLEDAEASLKQAITLKPDYVEAHSNLGTTLNELGRLEESEASYRQAISLEPHYAEAHNNLGITLK